MSEDMKQEITKIALDLGYTEDEIQKMIESGDMIFGGLL